MQFTATVQNSTSGVIWEIDGIPGGTAATGTITLTGLIATYQAPAAVPNPATLTVTAVLQSNSNTTASASLTVTSAAGSVLSIAPTMANVVIGGNILFTATVLDSDSGVDWEVNNIPGGNRTVGTVVVSDRLSATYLAPSIAPPGGAVMVTAVLQSDPHISISASVNITPPPGPSVTVSPSTQNIATNASVQFTATVQNSNSDEVTWLVDDIQGGNATVGTITSSGLFVAPSNVPNPASETITADLQSDNSVAGSATITVVSSNFFLGVFSWRNDAGLTGQNQQETMLTPASVTPGSFGLVTTCPLEMNEYVYAQPLYVSSLIMPGQGTPRNVLYVATARDNVYALDADTCAIFWKTSLFGTGETPVPSMLVGTGDFTESGIGVTGTPVIDPATNTLYVVAASATPTDAIQRLHALDLFDGSEKFGAPLLINGVVPGAGDGSTNENITFDPLSENQSGALSLSGGNVYIPFGSYVGASGGEVDPVHGWLIAYAAGTSPASALAQTGIFNITPNGSGGGVGKNGAPVSGDSTGNLFITTGYGNANAQFIPQTDFPQALIRLQAVQAGAVFGVVGVFSPSNQLSLTLDGADFGGTGFLVLPDQTGAYPHEGVVGDSLGNLYLIDRDLGGFIQNTAVQPAFSVCPGASCGFSGTPAYFQGTQMIYTAAEGDYLRAYRISNGVLQPTSMSQSTGQFVHQGASPVISSNGADSGTAVVWAVDTSGFGGPSSNATPAILHAYDANLSRELYSSGEVDSDAAGLAVKGAVPTVANGKVYIGTQGEISIYGLLNPPN